MALSSCIPPGLRRPSKENYPIRSYLLVEGTLLKRFPSIVNRFPPPSMPVAGIPCVALVMAKLIVDGEDCGIRPVVVALGDGKEMCKGVFSR